MLIYILCLTQKHKTVYFSILIKTKLAQEYCTTSLESYSSPNHTFIPSVSGLGFYNSYFNWANNIEDCNLVCTSEIPFDNYYTAPTNEDHIFIHRDTAAWILEEIQYGTQGCPNICATGINGTGSYMCTGTNYTFTLNESVT